MVNDSAAAAALHAVERVLSGDQPGFELVDGTIDGPVERFVVVPARGMPRLLLPLPTPAMRAALGSFVGDRPWAGLASPLIRAAARVGRPLRVSRELSLRSGSATMSPLRALLASVLGRDDFHLALRLSFGRPNAKTVVAAISGSGEILCFAKIGSETMTDDLVAHESRILERFAGTADSPVLMPRRLYADRWAGGGNVLITEPLQLEPLPRHAPAVHRAADAFAAASLVSSGTLRDSDYWRRIAERIAGIGENGATGAGIGDTIERIEAAWGGTGLDFGASHGDWSRANVGLVGGRVAALDWERCTDLAPRGIDIAHFAVLETSSRSRGRSLDIERVAGSTRQYLEEAGRPPDDAKPLVILAFLEMVVRFMTAQRAGLRTADSKFEPALQAGLQNWSA